MGMISDVLRKGGASAVVRDTARAVAEAVAAGAMRDVAAAGQEAATAARAGAFDRMVDALNRLPRPLTALGALALIGYAMDDPAGFAARMQGLRAMPTELWWLIGGVITFYFGAREAHYVRSKAAAGNAALPGTRPDSSVRPMVAPMPEPAAGPLVGMPGAAAAAELPGLRTGA